MILVSTGLYTARANHTCARFAASCGHELTDIKQWAAWGVDYMKDDSCGSCSGSVVRDYQTMQSAISTVGRDILLTIEGGPDITQVYTGQSTSLPTLPPSTFSCLPSPFPLPLTLGAFHLRPRVCPRLVYCTKPPLLYRKESRVARVWGYHTMVVAAVDTTACGPCLALALFVL